MTLCKLIFSHGTNHVHADTTWTRHSNRLLCRRYLDTRTLIMAFLSGFPVQ